MMRPVHYMGCQCLLTLSLLWCYISMTCHFFSPPPLLSSLPSFFSSSSSASSLVHGQLYYHCCRVSGVTDSMYYFRKARGRVSFIPLHTLHQTLQNIMTSLAAVPNTQSTFLSAASLSSSLLFLLLPPSLTFHLYRYSYPYQ